MAPADPVAAGRDRKINAVLELARDLSSALPISRDCNSTETLLADLNHNINSVNTLLMKTTNISSQTSKKLKESGMKLWNECIKQRRKKDDELVSQGTVRRAKFLARTRVFAFLIHALARETKQSKRKRDDGEEGIVSLMRLALTVARLCIEVSDLEGARLGLHKVADYIERLKSMEGYSHDDLGPKNRIEAEYLSMRMALSWKEDRLDVAEHMYNKVEGLRRHLDAPSAEHMADTLRHIGSDLSSKGDYPMALKWLRRAYELMNSQALELLSAEGLELRLSIFHHLVQVLLAIGSPEHLQEADDLVSYVESQIGDKPVVLHWKLEILQKSPSEVFDTDACASILRRMIRSIDLSDAVLSFLLHNIKGLHDRSPQLTMGLLDELLLTRLTSIGNLDWIGKAVVHRVWMSTMEPESSSGAAAGLMALITRITQESGVSLHVDVTIAAQSLMWKKVDALCTKKRYKTAESWCKAALHLTFSNCGETNQGKFGRKLIMCAIACNDVDAARSAFNGMPPAVQEDPLTRYLMFKAALACWDHELGCQSIEHLSQSSEKEKSQDILYACVKEAQQAGDRLCTLAALKAVVEKSDAGGSTKSHFPSILRCTIRLIHLIESQEGENQQNELVEDTCNIFEKALVSQARTEDKVEEQLQRYVEMRHHIQLFDKALESMSQTELGSANRPVMEDMGTKLSTLFVFDFEGAICLKAWDELGQIVRKARVCKDELTLKAMGDCLLRSQAPGKVLYATMRVIINQIFELEDFDNQRLAKYVRCMFQAVLPLDDNLALQVVDQALQIAREGNQIQKPFPGDELNWVVATTFNHAIDILARGDKALCHHWALKALDMAEYMDDGGDMRNVLQERVLKLGASKDAH